MYITVFFENTALSPLVCRINLSVFFVHRLLVCGPIFSYMYFICFSRGFVSNNDDIAVWKHNVHLRLRDWFEKMVDLRTYDEWGDDRINWAYTFGASGTNMWVFYIPLYANKKKWMRTAVPVIIFDKHNMLLVTIGRNEPLLGTIWLFRKITFKFYLFIYFFLGVM